MSLESRDTTRYRSACNSLQRAYLENAVSTNQSAARLDRLFSRVLACFLSQLRIAFRGPLTTATGVALKRTTLNEVHRALGARMVEFGGWEMPVEYPTGIIAEHLAVRSRAGLFDVSHMGEIEIRGDAALALVQFVTSNDASRLKINQAQYSALMYPQGTPVDDLLVHRLAEDHFFLCNVADSTSIRVEPYREEHASLRNAILQAVFVEEDDAAFDVRLRELTEAYERYARVMERDLLPLVEAHVSHERLEAIGTRMESYWQAAICPGPASGGQVYAAE